MSEEPIKLANEHQIGPRIQSEKTTFTQSKFTPQNKFKFPIYAVFGDCYDKWDVDILRGNGKVETIYSFTVDQMVKAYNKLRKKQGKAPRKLPRTSAYVMARDRAIQQKEKLEKTQPLR